MEGGCRNADSVVFNEEDQKDYFVKPHSFSEPFSAFLEYVRVLGSEGQSVKYAQSRKRHRYFHFFFLLNLYQDI